MLDEAVDANAAAKDVDCCNKETEERWANILDHFIMILVEGAMRAHRS